MFQSGNGRLLRTDQYTADGTWNNPAAAYIIVRGCGGGGGGGGAAATAAGATSMGHPGATAVPGIVLVRDPETSLAIVIGTGGAGGNNAVGTDGTLSSVIGSSTNLVFSPGRACASRSTLSAFPGFLGDVSIALAANVFTFTSGVVLMNSAVASISHVSTGLAASATSLNAVKAAWNGAFNLFGPVQQNVAINGNAAANDAAWKGTGGAGTANTQSQAARIGAAGSPGVIIIESYG